MAFTSIPSLRPELDRQIQSLRGGLAGFKDPGYLGAFLIGSCSLGRATYRSDVDLLIITRAVSITFSNVVAWRASLENHFRTLAMEDSLALPLPVQFTVVNETVFNSVEPEMKRAIREGLILSDPSGELQKLRSGATEAR